MAADLEPAVLVEAVTDTADYVNIAYPLVMFSLSLLYLCFLSVGKFSSAYIVSERHSYLLKSVSPLLTVAFV